MKRLVAFITLGASVVALSACGSSQPNIPLTDCTIANAPTLLAKSGADGIPANRKARMKQEVDQLNTKLRHWSICAARGLD